MVPFLKKELKESANCLRVFHKRIIEFNSLYNSFEALYGPQQPYIGKKDFLTRLTDPSYEYTSYSWFEGDFDGYYTLSLTRSVFNGQATIKAQFNKY